MSRYLVVAISGVTNGGKSTLTKQLLEVLPSSTKLICQDDYFHPEDSPCHVHCAGNLGHHNWDIITSLDMEKMKMDVRNTLNSVPQETSFVLPQDSEPLHSQSEFCHALPRDRTILLLDGFLIFDDAELTEMCDLRFFYTLTREQCWERRCTRIYDPPDPPGYFDHCVWPMYEKHFDHLKNIRDVVFLDGMDDHFEVVHQRILEVAKVHPNEK